jgi:hypothetical protein
MDKQLEETVAVVEREVSTIEQKKVIVNSEPTLIKAKDYLTEIKSMQKVVKEKKDGIINPLKEALSNAKDLFKPAEDRLVLIEKELKEGMLIYNNKLEIEKRKREQEALDQMEKGVDIDKATKKLENTTQIMGEIKTRELTEMEVFDKEALILELIKIKRIDWIDFSTDVKKYLTNGGELNGARLVKRTIVVS